VILKEEDVSVSNVRIDLTHGRHNPLERYLVNLIGHLFFNLYFLDTTIFPLVGAYIVFQNQLFQGTQILFACLDLV